MFTSELVAVRIAPIGGDANRAAVNRDHFQGFVAVDCDRCEYVIAGAFDAFDVPEIVFRIGVAENMMRRQERLAPAAINARVFFTH